MKTMFMALVLMIVPCLATAGEGDLTLFVKRAQGNTKSEIIPWMTYDTGKFYLDMRANFDWPDAHAVFLGKSFQLGKVLTLVPEMGMIWSGPYKAVSPEFMAYGGGKKWSWITLNQIALGSGSDRPDFAYHWVKALWKVNGHLQLGVGEQVYYEWTTIGAKPLLDIGPTITIPVFQKVHIDFWATRNSVDSINKAFFSIGTGF